MATRSKKPASRTAAKKTGAKRSASRREAPQASRREAPSAPVFEVGQMDLSKMAKMMTPAQAIDLYKANARMALDVINAAIENTGRLRRLQFEGEEASRA